MAVPFYGAAPAPADVALGIQTLSAGHLVLKELADFNFSQGILPVVDALQNKGKEKKPHGLMIHEGAGHGFHNDNGR